MNNQSVIENVVRVIDFTQYPSGRHKAKGNTSGEEFRDEFIIKKLKQLKGSEPLVVDLDGTIGRNSSFLDEVFAGLVTKRFITRENFGIKIIVRTTSPSIAEEVNEYITDALNRLDGKK
jgi:STAS-like domain of unknown function (DUF4325)